MIQSINKILGFSISGAQNNSNIQHAWYVVLRMFKIFDDAESCDDLVSKSNPGLSYTGDSVQQ